MRDKNRPHKEDNGNYEALISSPSHVFRASPLVRLLSVLVALANAAALPPRLPSDVQPSCSATSSQRRMWMCGKASAVCGGRFVLADATDRAKQEKDLADMTDASMMLGPIPIIWQFGTELCTSFRQGVVSMLESKANPEVRRARLAAEEAALTKEKQEEQADQLRRACVKGSWRDIATLAKKGADVNLRNCKDWQRWAPLHYSVAYGQVAATETLLDLGAQVNMQDWDQWTALHWAAYLAEPAHLKIAQRLIASGALLHETTWDGKTPLDLSLKYKHHAMVKVLQKAEEEALRGVPWWRQPRKAKLNRTGLRMDRGAFLDKLAAESFDPRLRADNAAALAQLAKAKAKNTTQLVT